MADNKVLEVKNLRKSFDDFIAVDGVSFHVQEGEILGLLGPNGAGKTTIIHMLLGLITPTSGEILVFGKDLKTHREEILSQVNFASPYVNLPHRLTVYENLMIFAGLYGVENKKQRISDLLELFDISAYKNTPMVKLSSGQNTRVGLCKALLNRPRLLLLDEPTASLDPEISFQTREILLKAQREEKTAILYTSHNMVEVEKMCNRIAFLNHGKLLAVGTPIEITKAILQEERDEPALEEVFFQVVRTAKP